jgi:hypothetical protein
MARDDAFKHRPHKGALRQVAQGDAHPRSRGQQALFTDGEAAFGQGAIEQGEGGLGHPVDPQLDHQIHHLEWVGQGAARAGNFQARQAHQPGTPAFSRGGKSNSTPGVSERMSSS